jgi:type I restriction enzyme S subunit
VNKEWATATLGELTTDRPICYGVLKPGPRQAKGVPLLRITDIARNAVDESDLYLITQKLSDEFRRSVLQGGEVLLSIQGTIGRVAICPPHLRDANISRTLALIAPDERVYRPFLRYWLLSQEGSFPTCGSTRASLNIGAIRELQAPVPPLPEQRRIVAILDEAFEGIAAAKANTERSELVAAELFCSQSWAEFDRLGNSHDWVTLSQLLDSGWIQGHLDGNHGSDYPRKEEFVASGVPYISANCLEADAVVMSRCKFLSPARAAKLRKGIAQNRDVLFAHNATVGPVAILETSEPKVILGTSLTYYRCDQANILPEYLALFMRSASFVAQYEQVMRQSTRNQVPITKQREFRHLIPSLSEQRRVIDRLGSLSSAARDAGDISRRKIAALDELKASLLHQAFTGQL